MKTFYNFVIKHTDISVRETSLRQISETVERSSYKIGVTNISMLFLNTTFYLLIHITSVRIYKANTNICQYTINISLFKDRMTTCVSLLVQWVMCGIAFLGSLR